MPGSNRIHKRQHCYPIDICARCLLSPDPKGWVLPGKEFASIDLFRLERDIEQLGAVRKCNAVRNIKGTLRLDIWQHNPLFLLEVESGSFYITKDGFIFPLDNREPLPVLLVNGEVPFSHGQRYRGQAEASDTWIREAIPFVDGITKDNFWAEKQKASGCIHLLTYAWCRKKI